MEIKKEDLEKRYQNLSDEKLIEIQKKGSLTDIAFSVLNEEFSRRSLTADKIQNIEKEKENNKEKTFEKTKPPKLPKVWVGYTFALAYFLCQIGEFLIYDGSISEVLSTKIEAIYWFIATIGWLYWLICVHRFHEILNSLTIDGYSISPNKAVGFHFIPLYNICWIFIWPYKMAEYINSLGKIKMNSGGILGLLILTSLLVSNLIDGSLGLACVFSVGLYINNKIKKAVTNGITIKNDKPAIIKESQNESKAEKMLLNKRQKRVIYICIFIIVIMLLFPPFKVQHPSGSFINKGYSFILNPPRWGMFVATVNGTTLLIQYLVVTLIGVGLCFIFKEK